MTLLPASTAADSGRSPPGTHLSRDYRNVRRLTEALLEGLSAEDCMVQAGPDVSPLKWHLAHTSWFFETFVLEPHASDYRTPSGAYRELFNSYYEAVGPQHPRCERGVLSRPTLEEVLAYRRHVDRAMSQFLEHPRQMRALIELGLHHEQQHQELMLMDLKFNFSRNPLRPAARLGFPPRAPSVPLGFERFEAGLHWIGHESDGFCFDNERPVHRRFVEAFELATRLTTNSEYLEFIRAGGYSTPSLWLSDGWAWVREHTIEAPLYYRRASDGSFVEFTLYGERPLDPDAPVCHVSGYEAEAFARFAGARLPTEFEWELAAKCARPQVAGGLESGVLHPRAASESGTRQLFGEVWQWTRSAYEPYPGFAPAAGAVGEYNGKFMCGQWVLRGGSVASPRAHVRPTYRNFFYPHQRWPFTGLRLAREVR